MHLLLDFFALLLLQFLLAKEPAGQFLVAFLDPLQLGPDFLVLGPLLRRWFRQIRLLRSKIPDKQVEPAIAVPIERTDLRTYAAPRLLGGVGPVGGFSRRNEAHARGQNRRLCGAYVSIEPNAAVSRPDQEIQLAVAVPVGSKWTCITFDA